jgi:hypothetical protein
MTNEKKISNDAASIRQRLYNLSKQQGEDFSFIISRFAVERFLFRLSHSPYADRFVLKGAQLFHLWTDKMQRPTRDLDLLGTDESSVFNVEEIFRKICSRPVNVPDGLEFLPTTVRGEEIREQAEYKGVRIRLKYQLGQIKDSLQVDIGFGDIVTPSPLEMEYGSLLDLPSARLKVYPKESVVSEKFQAMVMLGMGNSRMKDFFDLFIMAREFEFDGKILLQAIRLTFKRRNTTLPVERPFVLSSEFTNNPEKLAQWKAFLKRSGLETEDTNLTTVIQLLGEFLLTPVKEHLGGQHFNKVWPPGGPWKTKKRSQS